MDCPSCGSLQPGTISEPCSVDAEYIEGQGWIFPNADDYHELPPEQKEQL